MEIDDAYSTGSSVSCRRRRIRISRELVRGKTRPRIWSADVRPDNDERDLPLAYNKDMQEDKELTFDALDTVKGCLALFNRHDRYA